MAVAQNNKPDMKDVIAKERTVGLPRDPLPFRLFAKRFAYHSARSLSKCAFLMKFRLFFPRTGSGLGVDLDPGDDFEIRLNANQKKARMQQKPQHQTIYTTRARVDS
jgi:hypothetical protein